MSEGRWTEQQVALAMSELDRREQEGLRIYRPRPEQMPFHLSRAPERLIGGGNRSGKTACAAAEVASAALCQPIIDPDGYYIEHKFPDPPLVIWLIGFDERHIARMGRKLLKPGLFRCVRDEKSDRLRIWKGYDVEPELAKERIASPPLIPRRMIKVVAWENKRKGVFNSIELKNGSMLYAFPSSTEAAVGDAVHLVWVDEDVCNPEIIPELQARLADYDGYLIWSTWPRVSNQALLKMHEAADQDEGSLDPDVFRICLTFSGNPFLPPEKRTQLVRRWKMQGEAVLRARDRGELVTDSFLVFPTFDIARHGMPREEDADKLDAALAKHDWKVPPDWTWYLGLDPGHTRQAAVPLVIPPPSLGSWYLVPGEVYLEMSDADDLARVVAQRWGHVRWEAFVIDCHAGRQTALGLSTTVAEHYEAAFERAGLRCRQTGNHLVFGSDDIASRNMIIRQGLVTREDGTTRLRLMTDETQQLQREFRSYRKKVTRSDVHEEVIRRHNDAIDALAYVLSYDPVWVDVVNDLGWQPKDPIDRFLQGYRFGREESPEESIHMGAGALGL